MNKYVEVQFLKHSAEQHEGSPVAVYPKVYTFVDKCGFYIPAEALVVVETRNGLAVGQVVQVYEGTEGLSLGPYRVEDLKEVVAVVNAEGLAIRVDSIEEYDICAGVIEKVLPWVVEEMEM